MLCHLSTYKKEGTFPSKLLFATSTQSFFLTICANQATGSCDIFFVSAQKSERQKRGGRELISGVTHTSQKPPEMSPPFTLGNASSCPLLPSRLCTSAQYDVQWHAAREAELSLLGFLAGCSALPDTNRVRGRALG